MTKDEEFLTKFLEDDAVVAQQDISEQDTATVEALPSADDATLAEKEKQETAAIIKAEGEAVKAQSKAAKEAAKAEADRARKQRDALREQRRELRERREQTRESIASAKNLAKQIGAVADKAIQPAKAAADRISSARTVGGIGLLLVILFILLFTVVQVNAQGDTRLKQLWYMINGKAHLTGRKTLEVPKNPTDYTAEFQAVGQAEAQVFGDIATTVSQGVQQVESVLKNADQAVTNAANGAALGGVAQLLGINFDTFRNTP